MALFKKLLGKLLNVCFYLCLSLLLWVLAQVFCFTSFRIPTDSMEPVLIPGDNIIVNKIVGGARLFNVFAALNKEEVNIYRLPGVGSFKRNDVLVFNFPYPAQWDSIGFDVMKYYVKRCIALPGDTLSIQNGFFRVHGVDRELGNRDAQSFISSLADTLTKGIYMRSYPRKDEVKWTIKKMGPFHVPARGEVVKLDEMSVLLYAQPIFWEQKKRLTFRSNTVYLGDSVISSYRFEQNYYFVAGDKLKNSQDSRYWGLLPEDFIVGKAGYIWYSKNEYTNRIRRERLLNKIQ